MVKTTPSTKEAARQMQGLNSSSDTFTQKAVQRFERTGKRAKDKWERKIASRIAKGGGGMTVAELQEAYAQPTKVESRPVYPCAQCGKETPWFRKIGKGAAPRCGECRRKARLETKRKTWHRHKERYQANANRVRKARKQEAKQPQAPNTMPPPKPVEQIVAKPEPVAPPVSQGVIPDPTPLTPKPTGPVIVWTPRA